MNLGKLRPLGKWTTTSAGHSSKYTGAGQPYYAFERSQRAPTWATKGKVKTQSTVFDAANKPVSSKVETAGGGLTGAGKSAVGGGLGVGAGGTAIAVDRRKRIKKSQSSLSAFGVDHG
jgi:hypothetical protein